MQMSASQPWPVQDATRLTFFAMVFLASSMASELYYKSDLHEPNKFFQHSPQMVKVYSSENNKIGDEARQSESRVAGGMEANPSEFPWMAYILVYEPLNSGWAYVCNGALVSDQWVLTFDLCFWAAETGKPRYLYVDVTLGAHNIHYPNEEEKWTVFHSRTVVFSEQGDRLFALIKLVEPVRLTPAILPIALPLTTDTRRPGDAVTLVGWGEISGNSTGNSRSNPLRKVEVPIAPNAECNLLDGSSEYTCTSGEGNRGACGGDQGGSVIYYKNANGMNCWTLWAVITNLNMPCDKGSPSLHALVQPYLNWILATVGSEAYGKCWAPSYEIPTQPTSNPFSTTAASSSPETSSVGLSIIIAYVIVWIASSDFLL